MQLTTRREIVTEEADILSPSDELLMMKNLLMLLKMRDFMKLNNYRYLAEKKVHEGNQTSNKERKDAFGVKKN